METQQGTPLQAWLILIFIGLIWGSSYFMMSKGLESFTAIQMASLRISISSIAFLPFFIYLYKKIDWSHWKSYFIVGVLGSGVPAILFAVAQTQLTSSVTGVLGSTTPLFTLLIGMLFFQLVFKKTQIIGVVVGLIGAILIILLGNKEALGGNILYATLPILATCFYAYSSNTVQAHLKGVNSLIISAVSFIFIGIPMFPILLQSGFFEVMQTDPNAWNSFAYVAVLSLAGTFLASIFYFRLIQITSAVFASTVAYMIPIIATIIGIIRGEPMNFVYVIGLLLILSGVYLSRN